MKDFFVEAARKLTEIRNERLAKRKLKEKKKYITTEIKANAYQGKNYIVLFTKPEKEIEDWLKKLGYEVYQNRGGLWTISWGK